jgi:hypothetical protein
LWQGCGRAISQVVAETMAERLNFETFSMTLFAQTIIGGGSALGIDDIFLRDVKRQCSERLRRAFHSLIPPTSTRSSPETAESSGQAYFDFAEIPASSFTYPMREAC